MGRKKGNAEMPELDQLLKAIHERTTETRWGIGTAAHYLKSAEPFVADVGCTPEQWQKAIKEAEKQLTWCDEEMCDTELIAKSFYDGTELPAGFCGQFECVVTSNRKDRDGDVLEPSGFVLDTNGSCLYQHSSFHPTGRIFKETCHDKDRIKAACGIADTAFGRDNSILVKTGCVRISQGFKPFEFEPIKHKDADDGVPAGWHITRGEIREVSLVSIPSNVDAIITNFSQGKFASEEVKRWAKSYYDNRPVMVPVNIDLSLKVNGQEIVTKDAKAELEKPVEQPQEQVVETPPEDKQAEPETVKAGKVLNAVNKAKLTQAKGLLDEVLANADDMETDSTTDVTTKDAQVQVKDAYADLATKMAGMEDYLEGSFEFTIDKLRCTAADYARSKGVDVGRDVWASMVATFPDMAIVCLHEWGKDSYPCYRISYQVSENMPAWTGDAVAVEIKPTVVEKLAQAAIKAKGEQQAIVTKDAAAQTQMPEPPQEETIESLATKMLAKAVGMSSTSEALHSLESVQRKLGATVEVLKCEDVSAFLWE
jgi:hypothetical protein